MIERPVEIDNPQVGNLIKIINKMYNKGYDDGFESAEQMLVLVKAKHQIWFFIMFFAIGLVCGVLAV